MGHRRTGRKRKSGRRKETPVFVSSDLRQVVKHTARLLQSRELLDLQMFDAESTSCETNSFDDEWRQLPTVEDSIREELSHINNRLFRQNSFINHDEDRGWWVSLKDGGSTVTTALTEASTDFSQEAAIPPGQYWDHLINSFVESPYDAILNRSLAACLLNMQQRCPPVILWSKLQSVLLNKEAVEVLNSAWFAVPILGSHHDNTVWLLTNTIGRTLRQDPTLFEIDELD